MSEKDGQAVYNKLEELQSYVAKAVKMCDELAQDRAIVRLEASPFTKLTPRLEKLHGTLMRAHKDEICEMLLSTLRAGATFASTETGTVIKTEDGTNAESPTLINPAEMIMKKFTLFNPEVKTRSLQELLKHHNDPANTGLLNDSNIVLVVFRFLRTEEKKELLKRLIDM